MGSVPQSAPEETVMIDEPAPGTSSFDEDVLTDEELELFALASEPEPSLIGARPIHELLGATGESTLPEWYMPPVMRGLPRVHGWRRGVIFSFIVALVVIEAFGLCSTYG